MCCIYIVTMFILNSQCAPVHKHDSNICSSHCNSFGDGIPQHEIYLLQHDIAHRAMWHPLQVFFSILCRYQSKHHNTCITIRNDRLDRPLCVNMIDFIMGHPAFRNDEWNWYWWWNMAVKYIKLSFINDLPKVSKLFIPVLFADDTNLFYTGRELKGISPQINEERAKINSWVKANKLSLNSEKNKCMLFTPKNWSWCKDSIIMWLWIQMFKFQTAPSTVPREHIYVYSTPQQLFVNSFIYGENSRPRCLLIYLARGIVMTKRNIVCW